MITIHFCSEGQRFKHTVHERDFTISKKKKKKKARIEASVKDINK